MKIQVFFFFYERDRSRSVPNNMVQQNESYDELKKLTIAKLKSHTHPASFPPFSANAWWFFPLRFSSTLRRARNCSNWNSLIKSRLACPELVLGDVKSMALPFHFLFMHSLVRATHQAKFSFWAFLQHSQIDVNFTATFMYFLDPFVICCVYLDMDMGLSIVLASSDVEC